jgi:hypothetical protein
MKREKLTDSKTLSAQKKRYPVTFSQTTSNMELMAQSYQLMMLEVSLPNTKG